MIALIEIVIHRASSNCGQAAASDSFAGLGRAAVLGESRAFLAFCRYGAGVVPGVGASSD